MKTMRENILNYAKEQFGTEPEYLWRIFPNYAILRRSDNKKWFAVFMDVPKNKLGLDGNESIDILDVKCDPMIREIMRSKNGFLPAYHLNRDNWITVLLDGTVDEETIFMLIDGSYEITKGVAKKKTRHEITD